jgi:ADP-heptose:LPS heptosyltransferase
MKKKSPRSGSGAGKKVLVVRFSSIGDIVLTTPVVRCLKRQLGAEVHYLTKEAFRPVLAANPYIDRLHTIRKDVREVLPALRAEGFDFVADLHRNFRSGQLRRALGARSVAFSKLNLEKWLLVRFKADLLPRVHIVDRYMQVVQDLGVRYDGAGLDYFIPADEEVAPATWIQGGSYVALAIGAAHATKCLPVDQLIELCRSLAQPVLLLGGAGDRDAGEEVARQAGDQVVNLCGQLSLNQSASVVRQARVVISPDTGLMHIAAAFRKPILSVWGNTVPALGMSPFYPDGADQSRLFEVEGLSCRPCSKIGFKSCPKGHFRCMRDQNIGGIAFEAGPAG